ncbi:putative holin-like toxin [Anaerocolumna xylanovorans]
MTVAETLSLMITFSTFVINLITLAVHLIKMVNKK